VPDLEEDEGASKGSGTSLMVSQVSHHM